MTTATKTLLILFLAALTIATAAPKPPIGVPADAQHFNGKWYRVYLEKVPWGSAKEKCQRMGGNLVTIPDEATWQMVKELTKGAQLWIGASDESTPGVWKWVNGDEMTFTAWFPGQPDNAAGNEHYAAIYKGAWANVPKDGVVGNVFRAQGYVCEWSKR